MKITGLLHFCKTRDGEIGIADGYFAGDAWPHGDAIFEAVSGSKFGWIACDGKSYCDDRSFFCRPTQAEVVAALAENDVLYRIAKKRGIAE